MQPAYLYGLLPAIGYSTAIQFRGLNPAVLHEPIALQSLSE